MLLLRHNDGFCFKLTIEYTNQEQRSYKPYIRYSEDWDELMIHGLEKVKEIESNNHYVSDFRVQDDSK